MEVPRVRERDKCSCGGKLNPWRVSEETETFYKVEAVCEKCIKTYIFTRKIVKRHT